MSRDLPNQDDAVVTRAVAGDAVAFRELVTKYQDVAVGTAYGWLGDVERARDVAQEAFLDAHAHLPQLREPAAFSGWFRRILHKHCDRITRRHRPVNVDLAAVAGDEIPSSDSPERTAIEDQARSHLRLAVDALPVNERMVVALHYFAEATSKDVSVVLGLPESTVKKRLRSARRRLRDDMARLLQETIEKMRPSNTNDFAGEIALFIALRNSDYVEVQRLLGEEPTLVNALQNWDSDLVRQGVLPFANKATPLITAIERDDIKMQALLLKAGADVNGLCGCATGEAPIWAATLLNRFDHAKQLLEFGADPNAVSASGNRPLHLAAMRGMTELARLLIEHGADTSVVDAGNRTWGQWSPADGRDESGRTAAEWARVNGHTVLAEMIDGYRSCAAHDATASAATEIINGVVHTGIKALDLFAPIKLGGIIRFPFKAGVGMVVLLGEISQRYLLLERGHAVWTGFTQRPFDVGDLEADMAEFGLKDKIRTSFAAFDAPVDAQREALDQGLAEVERARTNGCDVLAVVLQAPGFEADVEATLLRLGKSSAVGSVTTIVVTPFPEKPEIWPTLQPPYSGQIVLDRARAKQSLFPAIHHSQSLTNTHTSRRHQRLSVLASELLDAYETYDGEFARVGDSVPSRFVRAQKLLQFMCQPFNTTEPFTGRPGVQVSSEELLDSVDAILNSNP